MAAVAACFGGFALESASPVRGDLIAFDTFESYAAGAQFESGPNSSPGTGLSGGWGVTGPYDVHNDRKSQVTVGSAGLSYANGAVSVGGGSRSMQIAGAGDTTGLVTRPIPTQTDTIYFSFLLRTNNLLTDEDFFQFGFSDANNNEPRLSIGLAGTSANSGASKFFARAGQGVAGTSFGSPEISVQPATTYFLVGKISKDNNTNYNKVELFLNPSTLTEPVPTIVSPLTNSNVSSLSYFSIRRFRTDATDLYWIDELRIGSSYASVVPEPSVLVLALIAVPLGIAISARRRRR